MASPVYRYPSEQPANLPFSQWNEVVLEGSAAAVMADMTVDGTVEHSETRWMTGRSVGQYRKHYGTESPRVIHQYVYVDEPVLLN